MDEDGKIQLFEDKRIRTAWDEEGEELYFSVVDVIGVLTDSKEPRRYWSDLKIKLKSEGNELYEKIVQLKMTATDGKKRLTDVVNTEELLRIIQSIPSPKAEPFKMWLAQVGQIAGNARREIEKDTGQPVISSKNAIDFSEIISATIDKDSGDIETE
jgi:prophage antirepressor-like protein